MQERFDILKDKLLDDGFYRDLAKKLFTGGEEIEFLIGGNAHGWAHAAERGFVLFVGGKVYFTVTEAGMYDLGVQYRNRERAFAAKVLGEVHSNMAQGSSKIRNRPWQMYNINNNARLSVDFYYYVTDQIKYRPPSCVIEQTC